ncbi:MAG: hypothetical protein O2780_04135 [Proteobacteria bacterium]|nr:hypothetical protein [Pseudomonadota bacterium]MDA1300647.1 hypothetical protein [Pseudomonadota bacterium]
MNEQVDPGGGSGRRWLTMIAAVAGLAALALLFVAAQQEPTRPAAASSPAMPPATDKIDSTATKTAEPTVLTVMVPAAPTVMAHDGSDSPVIDDGNLGRVTKSSYYQLEYPEETADQMRTTDPVMDMFFSRTGTLTALQRERYNELHIVPWNPVVEHDCSVPSSEELPPGARSCKPVAERQFDHPYSLLTTRQLREMGNDPAAILMLAKRPEEVPLDREQRLAEYARASAIADKPGELLQFAYWAMVHRPGKEAALRSKRTRYVLERVTQQMGDERSQPEARRAEFEEALELHGMNAKQELEAADIESERLLDQMNQTRLEVLGLPITLIEREQNHDQ